MPNVVLISVDCLRADRVFDSHRYTTPTLHKLRSHSLVFDAAYATGPYTTESIPGLIAGRYSYNGTYYGDDVTWKAIADSPTIASWLRDQGYETTAVLTNPHLSRERNFDQGFDHFENLRLGDEKMGSGKGDSEGTDDGNPFQLGSLLYDLRSRMRRYDSTLSPYTLPMIAYRYAQTHREWPTVSGETVVDAFSENVGRTDEGQFAWVHLMDLHAPLRPSTVRAGGLSAVTNTFSQLKCDAARAARIHEPRYNTMYDSALRYVDNRIHELINHLREIDEWEDTVLIITGDHGEVLYDRNSIYGHPPHHLYDELLHVPLIVRTPDNKQGRIDEPVSLAWVHELIADVCDLETGDFPSTSGRKSLLKGRTDGNPIVADTIDDRGHTITVRDGQHKFIHHEPTGTDSEIKYRYGELDIQFSYREDPKERLPKRDTLSQELSETAEELTTHPTELPALGDGFSRTIEDRLHDLGYRA